MKQKKSAMLLILLPLLAGCATEGFVNRQIDPIIDRQSRLESKMSTLELKLSEVESMASVGTELSPDDQAALKEAEELSKMAFEKACRVEEAVKRAENAAAETSNSARKNQKIFELQQKK